MDARTAATLRAVAEVFVPGPPHDDTPGAPDVAAERFLAHYLDFLLPGLVAALAELLDARAGDSSFSELALDERGAILATLAEDESPQLRELVSVLAALSIAAVYGEWTGQDPDGSLARAPLGWTITGFDGPSRGRIDLLR